MKNQADPRSTFSLIYTKMRTLSPPNFTALKTNHPQALHHYTIAHQLFTQLGTMKDIEKIEQEWENPQE
jgi:hypothetical protein